jgi:hypothetical protein
MLLQREQRQPGVLLTTHARKHEWCGDVSIGGLMRKTLE